MQVTTMEILGWDGENGPTLPFSRATRDALAKYCELRWPNGRRKAVCKRMGADADEARSICEATASITTIEKVWKHPRGQWAVAIPVLGAVIGVHLDDHLEAKRRNQMNGLAALARWLAIFGLFVGQALGTLLGAILGVPANAALTGAEWCRETRRALMRKN
jgi:hypothetical protein